MNHNSILALFTTTKRIVLFLFLVSCLCICLAFVPQEDTSFEKAKREVLLRRMGHELLLLSGDSISRVAPIQTIHENEYQIQFENQLTFTSDSLVALAQRLLNKDPYFSECIIKVYRCDSNTIVYSFAISKKNKNDLITCLGRKQAKACYTINVQFKPENKAYSSYIIWGSIGLFVSLLLFVMIRKRYHQKQLVPNSNSNSYTLGLFEFKVPEQQLLFQESIIELTGTETRLLRLFAAAPNKTIARSVLQKEIWEDEGVIVSRSLDMFISKLRKKLENDPATNIVVVRSKGYRLEIPQ